MPGRDPLRPELTRALPEAGELDELVAAHTRVRRATRQIVGDKRVDHIAGEDVAEVHHIERDAELCGDTAGIEKVVERATTTTRRVAPQPHGDADDLVSGFDQQGRGNRAVDAAAHTNDDAVAAPRGDRVEW